MDTQEIEQYELARRVGDKRFGSACKHKRVRNGRCLECYRSVVVKGGSYG